ncbi:MAG: hypothetical protein ACLFWR_04895 [Acidimicrobiales bacterium]
MTSIWVPVALVAGALVATGSWWLLRPIFEHPVLERTNVRGLGVPTAGGLVVVLAALVPATVLRVWSVLAQGLPEWIPEEARFGWDTVLVAALGFGLLGLVDDLLGDQGSRGFAGHLTALRSGRLTTGGLKLLGGGVLSLYLATRVTVGFDDQIQFLIDAALIALAANLANLLDRAPGRVTKVALMVGVALAIAGPTTMQFGVTGGIEAPPVAIAFVVGAAIGVLVPELREQMMLGDTGANVVGAALGLGAVIAVGEQTRLIIVVGLVVLNLLSERVSFSRVIGSTPGLRHLDQWGRATG